MYKCFNEQTNTVVSNQVLDALPNSPAIQDLEIFGVLALFGVAISLSDDIDDIRDFHRLVV